MFKRVNKVWNQCLTGAQDYHSHRGGNGAMKELPVKATAILLFQVRKRALPWSLMKRECSISRGCMYQKNPYILKENKKAPTRRFQPSSFCISYAPRTGGREADRHHSPLFRDKTPWRTFQATGRCLAPVISPRKQWKVSNPVILSPIC